MNKIHKHLDPALRKTVDQVVRKLADDGRLIEGGFAAFRHITMPADAPPEAIESARTVFMAGAQHLWGCMFGMVDESDDASPDDMRRMTLVNNELETWYAQFEKQLAAGAGTH